MRSYLVNENPIGSADKPTNILLLYYKYIVIESLLELQLSYSNAKIIRLFFLSKKMYFLLGSLWTYLF